LGLNQKTFLTFPIFLFVFLSSCASGSGHEVMASHDVRVAGGAAGDPQGYEYVARRPLAVVAMAEARGLDAAVARAATERLADQLDACVTEEGRRGTLVEGAARVVAQIDENGNVSGTNIRVDPAAGAAKSAVVCLVAPMKFLAFPAGDGGARGIAIEAIWGKVSRPPPDGGETSTPGSP
jgi:hypothetical protein